MKKLSFINLILISIGILFSGCDPSIEYESRESEFMDVKFAPPVEKVLLENMKSIEQKLQSEVIIESLMQSNQSHAGLPISQILKIDQAWINGGEDSPFIRERLEHACSNLLKSYQEQLAGFDEIFITDRHGMNVCQTNRTSDWYQADEDWWLDSFQEGKGKSHHGQIEYDESAGSESISLYMPVYHPDTRELMGITKAVISLERIKQQL